MYISAKFTPQCANPGAENAVIEMFNNSAELLGTDYMDFYWIHNPVGAPKWAKEYGNRLCRLSVISGAASGAVLLIISPLIFAVTDLSDTADTYLKYMIVMCACYMVGKSVNSTTIGGIFCAGGDSKFGTRVSFICLATRRS